MTRTCHCRTNRSIQRAEYQSMLPAQTRQKPRV